MIKTNHVYLKQSQKQGMVLAEMLIEKPHLTGSNCLPAVPFVIAKREKDTFAVGLTSNPLPQPLCEQEGKSVTLGSCLRRGFFFL